MANTVSIAALRPEIWQKELHKDVMDALFFNNNSMIGTDENNVVQIKNELTKTKGDAVTFGLTAKINAAAITGDNELEGNEVALSSYAESVNIDQARFGVRLTGRLDEQKAAYDMRMDAKNKLAIGMAEFIERQIFMKLGGVTEVDLTDVNSVTYSADATWSNSSTAISNADETDGAGSRYLRQGRTGAGDGLDDLVAGDILTTTSITQAKTKAKLASPKIVPLRIKGREYYTMFIHPWQTADLKTDSSSNWETAARDAQVRGNENPIFTGALGIWDGVILHDHEYVPTVVASADFDSSGVAAGVRAFRALLCGRQAIAFAQSKNPNGFVEETFDYKNKVGYATSLIGGIDKVMFNSLEYGVIAVDSSATAIA